MGIAKYNGKSMPTMYKGIQFRSRLEARWACFFDLVQWKWEYEPEEDDKIKGWMPDFTIYGDRQETLVEVKYYTQLQEFIDDGEVAKILQAKDEREVLLLGKNIIFVPTIEFSLPRLGWIMAGDSIQECGIMCHEVTRRYGFFDTINSWQDRISGIEDHHKYHGVSNDTIRDLWIDAKNKIQWKGVSYGK